MLNLKRNNYAVLIDNRPSFLGMLKTAQSFVTWGEISKETLTALLKERGRLVGNKRLTDDYAKKLGYASLEECEGAKGAKGELHLSRRRDLLKTSGWTIYALKMRRETQQILLEIDAPH